VFLAFVTTRRHMPLAILNLSGRGTIEMDYSMIYGMTTTLDFSLSGHKRNMVAAGNIFLLCLTASSYPCRHGITDDVRRHLRPLFSVKSSSLSRSSSPRREERKKSFLSARQSELKDK
jgi:hypothetical protein